MERAGAVSSLRGDEIATATRSGERGLDAMLKGGLMPLNALEKYGAAGIELGGQKMNNLLNLDSGYQALMSQMLSNQGVNAQSDWLNRIANAFGIGDRQAANIDDMIFQGPAPSGFQLGAGAGQASTPAASAPNQSFLGIGGALGNMATSALLMA